MHLIRHSKNQTLKSSSKVFSPEDASNNLEDLKMIFYNSGRCFSVTMSDSFTEHTRGNNSRFLKYQTFCKCGFYKISETYTRSCTCMQKRENLQISAQIFYPVARKHMSDLSQYAELKSEGYPLAIPPLTLTIRGLPSRLAKTDGFESTFNAN